MPYHVTFFWGVILFFAWQAFLKPSWTFNKQANILIDASEGSQKSQAYFTLQINTFL